MSGIKEGRSAVQKFPMTAEGLARLEEELKQLKAEERPAIIRAIAEARSHGDLSENAEYHAARERQSFIEGRIAELESIIPAAEVIDTSRLSGDQVKFGARVTIIDEETEEEKTYRIVGAYEADMKEALAAATTRAAEAERAPAASHAFDEVHAAARGGEAERQDRLVFGAVVEVARGGHVGEFDDHDPARGRRALARLDGAAAHHEAAAIGRDHARRLRPVRGVAFGIGDLDLGDQIGGHGGTPRGSGPVLRNAGGAGHPTRATGGGGCVARGPRPAIGDAR